MRKAWVALLLVAVVGVAALGSFGSYQSTQTFLAIASPQSYQRFTGETNGAFFTNNLGVAVTGLRVTFAGSVSPVSGYGIGATGSFASSGNELAVFAGTIPAGGTVYVEWPSGAPDIVAAAWLQGEDVAGLINLYEIVALIQGREEGTAVAHFPVASLELRIDLDGSRSRSPSERPIVRYVWEWSDGVVQEGVTATRTFTFSVNWQTGQTQRDDIHAVTLTVWNAAGESSTVTTEFPGMKIVINVN
jgi:hypothetical protein